MTLIGAITLYAEHRRVKRRRSCADGGSGKQATSVINGIEADVVTLALVFFATTLNFIDRAAPGEIWLNVDVFQPTATAWSPAEHRCAWDQWQLPAPLYIAPPVVAKARPTFIIKDEIGRAHV